MPDGFQPLRPQLAVGKVNQRARLVHTEGVAAVEDIDGFGIDAAAGQQEVETRAVKVLVWARDAPDLVGPSWGWRLCCGWVEALVPNVFGDVGQVEDRVADGEEVDALAELWGEAREEWGNRCDRFLLSCILQASQREMREKGG